MSRPERLVLCLYLAGNTPVAARAVVNTRRFCEEHLAGSLRARDRRHLAPSGASAEAQIIAAPTLVKKLPLPEQRVIGDMSRTERLVQRFDPGRRAA